MAREAKKAHDRISQKVKMGTLQASAAKREKAVLACLQKLAIHLSKGRKLPLLPPLCKAYLPEEVVSQLSKHRKNPLELTDCQLDVSLKYVKI